MKDKIIQYRVLIVVVSIAVTLLSLFMFPRLEVNPDLDDYVPDHLGNKVHLRTLDSIFGGSELLLVMLKSDDVVNKNTLNRLNGLAEDLKQLEGIDQVITPFESKDISYSDGFMRMEPLLGEIPEDKEQLYLLKEKISSNRMAQRFFTDDFNLVALILTKNNQASDLIVDDVKEVIAGHPGGEEVLIGGLPFIKYSITGNIRKDLLVLIPLALVLMVFMLFFSFREWKGVFMPFIIVVMSVIISFAIMALLGWKISLITILMPVMLIAIANDYGIHMIARYQELARGSESFTMKQICKQIYTDLKQPIMVTGITTIAGVLGLLTHTMVPAAQLGVLIALGIAFALLLSVYFLPALLSFFNLPGSDYKTNGNKMAIADKWLNRFSRWAMFHPRRIVIISVIIAMIGISGFAFIKVDTNIEGYFLGKSDVRRSIDIINEEYGGAQFLSIVFTGDVLSPDLLKRMEAYEEIIKGEPAVGQVSSPVVLIKELSKGFYDVNEEGYNQIPTSAEEVYQFLEVFAMGENTDAIEQFIDYNYENARIIIGLKDSSTKAGKELYKMLKELTKDDPDVAFVAGAYLTKIELADMVVNGQIKSLLFALFVVFLLLSIVFRSARAGILSSVPLSVAVLVLFGLMGYLGIAVDIATALLSSIMIGVGVDYTIHFLWRFKEERSNGFEHKEAARITLVTTGRGIVFNAFSVIVGFSVLAFSNFAPLRFFSALIVISISTCLICALLLVPSIVILTKPGFLEP